MTNLQLGNPQYGGLLSPEDYKVLQMANVFIGNEVNRVLNENGVARFTVCPICRCDDFTHVEGCNLIPTNVQHF